MARFRAGDPCLLYDEKGRQYLIDLVPGKDFHFHHGVLPHDVIIGSDDGSVHESSKGARLVTLRPRLADYALKMPRGAAVVYPKDLGAIIIWADVGPGMTVVEAGTGSGALAMALARAVGPGGRVVSYERRDDHAAKAHKLIRGFFGEVPTQLDLRHGEVETGLGELSPDRVILDVPEPWHIVKPAVERLVGGGIFCCYLPTVPQVQTVRTALDDTESFHDTTTFEVLHREWSVDGRSVRPSHRMIGHTGFITVARKIQPEDLGPG